jgi:nicotinamide mononucleotide transporter
VWIAVDVLYVGMFIFKGLYLTAGLYAVFLGLAIKGYLDWRRSMETTDAGMIAAA